MNVERKPLAIERILQHRVSAIIRTTDERLATDAIQAAVDGGFRIVEFTLTTPGAFKLIERFASDGGLAVGAGTVLQPQQARDAVAAGASFIVSPITDPVIIDESHALGVACIPGAYTPTEMEMAHRCGADFVKVFPMPPGGVDFIVAIRLPLPHLRLFPTAGVDENNVVAFLEAGCAGVGFVRTLFTPHDMAERNFAAIRATASTITSRVTDWLTSHEPRS